MKKLVSLLILLMAAILSLSVFPRVSNADAQGKAKTPDSKAVYQAQCAKCHGDDGKGIPSLPDIPNFADPKWQSSRTNKKIADVINVGAGIMPGFKETLSVAGVRSLVKHVRSFAPAGAKPKTK